MMSDFNWEGVENKIAEHRTVGPHRAWCFNCHEWCYSDGEHCQCCMEVKGITLDNLIAELRQLHQIYTATVFSVCDHCKQPWPCETVRILDTYEGVTHG